MCPDERMEDSRNPFHTQYDSGLKKTKMTHGGGYSVRKDCSSACPHDRGNQTGGILYLPTHYRKRSRNDLRQDFWALFPYLENRFILHGKMIILLASKRSKKHHKIS